jgi:hypothetical protein
MASRPKPPTLGELWVAFRDALIPLGMPAIIFGGILGGIMTPTEASVLAVLYAAVVGLFVYREIQWKELPAIMMNAAMITGAVGLLLGTAGVVSWFLTVQQMPAALIRIMTVVPGSSLVFLSIPAAILIFFGGVIVGLPAGVILLPCLLRVGRGLGIDPIHYARSSSWPRASGSSCLIGVASSSPAGSRRSRWTGPPARCRRSSWLIGPHHRPGAADHADPAPPLQAAEAARAQPRRGSAA